MLPIRDNIPHRRFPFVNYAIIAICGVAFLAQQASETDDGRDRLSEAYGMIPARVLHPDQPITVDVPVIVRTRFGEERGLQTRSYAAPPFSPWLTLLTCIFLHGSWMHILGNMWFLHIFGDNVEDRFGHLGYLLFYLGGGIAASVSHLLSATGSEVPTIGASGAIACVMGAYMRLYPHAKVLAILPIFVFVQMFVVPAPLFLGIWFIMQLLEGASASGAEAGVAWWAHIGGFAVGYVFALFLEMSGATNPPVQTVLPNTERMTHYRYRRERPW